MENASEEPLSVTVSCHERLNQLISGDSLDFVAWKALITEVETFHPDDIDIISSAYDSLLLKFPSCHWYWQRYAYHHARLCNGNKAVEIFEKAVELTPFSVGLWYEYCNFAITYSDNGDNVRRLFQKGMTIVGKDYYCHVLWDKYILFEFSQQKWAHLANVYAQALHFPTKKLHKYYKIFKDLVTALEDEIQSLNNGNLEVQADPYKDASALSDKEISQVVNDLWDPSDISVRCKALHRYKVIGDQLYEKACQLDKKIKNFESNIRRHYFDATPLDDDQLNNWHQYLDFIEEQKDFDWALKLYERCLISCANYPEFWMRYVDFMEAQGGRELAMFAIERATKVYLNNIPGFHLFSARFMEQIQDIDGARAFFSNYDPRCDIYIIESVVKQANMEWRLGNQEAACEIYEKALRWATSDKERKFFLPKLYIHYYHLKCVMTGGTYASRDVLIKGIKQVPDCRLLYEELIRFAMVHDGAKQLRFIETVITTAISSSSDELEGLDIKDREYISTLFLEFVDLCGTVHDVRKAWNLHIKLFPQFIRVNPLYKRSTLKERQSNDCILLNLQSEKQSSGHVILPQVQEMLTLPPLVDDRQPSSVPAERISTLNDDVQPSSKVSVEFEDESKTDALKQLKLINDLDLMDCAANSTCQSKEDASRPLEPICEFEPLLGPNLPTETSQEEDRSINGSCPKEIELQCIMESVSLEEHSSDSQRKVNKAQVLVASDNGNNKETPTTGSSISAEFHNGQGGPVVSQLSPSPVSWTQGNLAGCMTQTWEQVGGPTNQDQAFNQMWQYHYQQQYQQFLQMQQSYPHLQLQQQYIHQTYQHQLMPYLQQMPQHFQQQYQQMVQPVQPYRQVQDQQLQAYNQYSALAYQYQMNPQGYQQLLKLYQQDQQALHAVQQEQGGYPQAQQHQEQEQLDQSEQVMAQSKTTATDGS
ncbi:unnamed protein product [Cuscuta epithymum]|uniref:Pre-mRNA-processing factor 39 n=1 Tax=Cuscuta epithymum TaxID=186058 RepID=A0AAV0E102_9ASTE|nr:unnamed protein product [Cuscuta epithymum]